MDPKDNDKSAGAQQTGQNAQHDPTKDNPEVAPPQPLAPPTAVMEVEDVTALSRVTVLIDRDANTRIPAIVFGFEVPVMVAVYGEERVFVIGEEEADGADFDVERAYDGLRTKYRKHGDALRQVYRSLGDFARQVGVRAPSGVRPSSRDKQSLQKIRKPQKKSAAKK